MNKFAKKVLMAGLLALMLAVSAFAVPSVADGADSVMESPEQTTTLAETVASGTCGTNLTWTLDDEGTLTISGSGDMKNWSYSSNAPWYSSSSSIKKVVIGDGVTRIGSYAFYSCTSLTSIEIPDSVTSIGNWAFYGCTSLTSVEIGDGVTSIGNSAFYRTAYNNDGENWVDGVLYISNCLIEADNSISGQYTIKEGTILIADSAFSSCTSLTSIEIPDSVTSIGDSAFSSCTSLTSIEIPDSVTSIGEGAFSNCTSLTSVEIPDSVTGIGYMAFYGCTSLTSVDIGDSVTSIGDRAFGKCTSLTSVDIGDGATSIGDWAFSECTSLTSVDIGDSVTSIGSYAFYNCTSLTSIEIPDSVTSIGSYAFYKCTSLTSVEIPDSVESIGEAAFSNCTSLTSVSIGDSVTSIGDRAFYYCSSLTSVEIGDGATSIGDSAFNNCSKLTSVEIGDSVTSIGSYAFYKCTSLTSVEIPDSVESIGEDAFSNCTSLTSVDIGDSVTSIGDMAFYNCTSLTSVSIGDSVTSIGSYAFNKCTSLTSVHITDIAAWCGISFSSYYSNPLYYAKNLYLNDELVTELVIPEGVTSIGDYAFSGCTSLTSVEIGDGATSIGDWAFYKCTSLTSVHITDIAAWCGISFSSYYSNPLYYAKNLYLNDELVTELVIPEGVTSIGNYAFYNCTSLTSVEIGDSVTSIGDRAFYYCSSLTSVDIGDGATSIGDWAFYNCTSLTSVSIGDSVTSIGSYAFNKCTSLTSVHITDIAAWCGISFLYGSDNPLYYAKNLYLNDELVTELVIPEGVTSIGNYAFYSCTSLTSIEIPDSVTSIGDYAFSNCTSLTSVSIGDSVTSIGDYAFNYCSSLTSVDITDSVESIGDCAFYCCTALTSVDIPDNVTSIGDMAFSDCYKLTSIDIPDSVESIGDDAFCRCGILTITVDENNGYYSSDERGVLFNKDKTTLILYPIRNTATAYEIPDSVTSIGDNAFYFCMLLTSVDIPDSVESIGELAFYGCYSLTSITVDENNEYYSSDERGVLFNKDKTTLIQYPAGNTATTYNISDSVTSIGIGAFMGCSSLTSVDVGDGATSIGSSAFSNCTSLKSIKIPAGVTSIGYWYSSPNITIYGYSGSYAETYANNNSIPFIALDATSITIPLPSKASDGNVLYAEIDGVQTELTGDSLEITPLKDMLVEIVEKESADSVFTISTKYYFVDNETMTYTELSGLSSYTGNEDEASLRTNNPLSIRFKSYIMTASRNEETAFTIEEYGFIIGIKASLEAKGEQLNFDASKYVSGVAFNRENGTDIVFDATDDEVYLFTGLLTNIPEKNYATEVVSKTYTKINVGGEVFTVYGEPVTASLYSVAKSLVSDGTELTEEQAAVVENIIKAVEYVDNN